MFILGLKYAIMWFADIKHIQNMFAGGAEMDSKVDYKEMYLKMVRASEKVMDILIKAQQECEEMYIEQSDEPE